MIREPLRFCLPILLAGVTAGAASKPVVRADFRSDANLVLVGATVLDGNNRVVRGLTQADFRLFEGTAEQKIVSFSEADLPVSLVILFDTSGSMDGKLPAAREALTALLQTSNPEDEFCLIRFADRPDLAVPWTHFEGEILSRVLATQSVGRTALLDAVSLGIEQLRRSHNSRRALAIFSDGGDNYSRATQANVTRMLEEADVQMYAVNMPDASARLPRSSEEVFGPNLLADLCDRAGGRYFSPDGRRELDKVADQIGKELRSQYVLGYSPTRLSQDGKVHSIQLKVLRRSGGPKLWVFWRRGYRAPAF